ncbi:MAG: hypothetical protein ABI409_19920, partial [Ramlibacter sp.]
PMVHHPAPNYARLCVPFVAAAEVIFGGVDPGTFQPRQLGNADLETLARRVTTGEKHHPNPNAFYPQSLTLELADGERITRDIPYAWGHPQLPLTPQEREDKFRLCWRLTRESSAEQESQMEDMLDWLRRLPDARDASPLVALLASRVSVGA